LRYPPLLIALSLAMLLKPFGGASATSFGFFMVLVFVTVVYAFRHIAGLALSLTILGVGAVTLRIAGGYWQILTLEVTSHAMSCLAMLLVMVAMLSEVLRARTASTDLIIGAVCLYLVIGLAWTFLYYSIYLLSPNSIFAASGPAILTAAANETRFTEIFYFSLSALTTIGSSGEEQLTTMARQLAVVESAMGQLYLAVLISRLVGFNTTSDAKAPS
jgi:hypothetical protein